MVIDFLERYQLDCDLILNNGTQYCNKQQTFNEIYPMDNQAFQRYLQFYHHMVIY